MRQRFAFASSVFFLFAVTAENSEASINFAYRPYMTKKNFFLKHLTCYEKYSLSEEYRGDDFWNAEKFEFFSEVDPTEGVVQYLSKEDALRGHLIETTADGRATLSVDTKETLKVGEGRKSVRITSLRSWQDALWVLDINHMPVGCGVWPAFWTWGGAPWPDTGEIDVIESCNLQETSLVTVHTAEGCVIPQGIIKDVDAKWGVWNGVETRDCWALATPDNTGCSMSGLHRNNGPPLNEIKGGVFVLEVLLEKHIRVWFFKRDEVPLDLRSNPTPQLWKKRPIGFFPFGAHCDGKKLFKAQHAILNTTFCGGFAGDNFREASGCPGNGRRSCEEFVRENPQAFKEAYWDINYLKVFVPRFQACAQ